MLNLRNCTHLRLANTVDEEDKWEILEFYIHKKLWIIGKQFQLHLQTTDDGENEIYFNEMIIQVWPEDVISGKSNFKGGNKRIWEMMKLPTYQLENQIDLLP